MPQRARHNNNQSGITKSRQLDFPMVTQEPERHTANPRDRGSSSHCCGTSLTDRTLPPTGQPALPLQALARRCVCVLCVCAPSFDTQSRQTRQESGSIPDRPRHSQPDGGHIRPDCRRTPPPPPDPQPDDSYPPLHARVCACVCVRLRLVTFEPAAVKTLILPPKAPMTHLIGFWLRPLHSPLPPTNP